MQLDTDRGLGAVASLLIALIFNGAAYAQTQVGPFVGLRVAIYNKYCQATLGHPDLTGECYDFFKLNPDQFQIDPDPDGTSDGILTLKVIAAPGTNPERTDKLVHPEPTLPALPPAGEKFTDPTFGTTIMRLTDANTDAGENCNWIYGPWVPFNSNQTRIVHVCDQSRVWVADFNASAFTVSNRRMVDMHGCTTGDFEFSPVNPDEILCMSGTSIIAVNVSTQPTTYRVIKNAITDHPGRLIGHQVVASSDGDTFAGLVLGTDFMVKGVFVYRASTSTFLLWDETATTAYCGVDQYGSGNYHGPALSKDGDYFSIGCDTDANKNMLIKLSDMSVTYFDQRESHADQGVSWWIGASEHFPVNGAWGLSLVKRSYTDPSTHTLILPLSNHFNERHQSLQVAGDGWVAAAHCCVGTVSAFGDNEILMAKTDGSQSVLRLVHHRTKNATHNWDLPFPAVSRDGAWLMFNSNWGDGGRWDAFIVKTGLQPQSAPLRITTQTLPDATIGVPYTFQLQVTGGTPPYTWSVEQPQ